MPTLADAAAIPLPTAYGPLDGVSFFPRLTGQAGLPRDWIFCHFMPNMGDHIQPLKRWVQDTEYKLYDSTNLFYHYTNDLFEERPISDSELTIPEKKLKLYFQSLALRCFTY